MTTMGSRLYLVCLCFTIHIGVSVNSTVRLLFNELPWLSFELLSHNKYQTHILGNDETLYDVAKLYLNRSERRLSLFAIICNAKVIVFVCVTVQWTLVA